MRTPYRPGVDRVECKVGSPKVFSLSVSTPPLFASSNQIIRAHYHLIQAERSSHYHLLSAENDDVIKHGCGCNQFATHTQPPLLAYPAAKADSVGYPENSQLVSPLRSHEPGHIPWCLVGRCLRSDVRGDDPLEIWACNLLSTKHFHGVSSGNQHPYLLTSRYGKVS